MTEVNNHSNKTKISAVTARLFEHILKMSMKERRALLEKLDNRSAVSAGKRKSPRESYYKSVDFATKDHIFRGFIQNISADGILIEATGSFSVGQNITLSFELPEDEGHIKINGEIVRLLPAGGFALKFRSKIKDFK